MKVWHTWQLKKLRSCWPFWNYQLNCNANSALLAYFWGKWAELAVLFCWWLQDGPQDFEFFNYHGCQTFILAEIHCYLSAIKNWPNNSFLSGVPRKHLKDLIVGKVVPDVHNLFPISERFRNFQASSSALHPPLLLLLLHSELFFYLILLSH